MKIDRTILEEEISESEKILDFLKQNLTLTTEYDREDYDGAGQPIGGGYNYYIELKNSRTSFEDDNNIFYKIFFHIPEEDFLRESDDEQVELFIIADDSYHNFTHGFKVEAGFDSAGRFESLELV